jgi:hypothetical protein
MPFIPAFQPDCSEQLAEKKITVANTMKANPKVNQSFMAAIFNFLDQGSPAVTKKIWRPEVLRFFRGARRPSSLLGSETRPRLTLLRVGGLPSRQEKRADNQQSGKQLRKQGFKRREDRKPNSHPIRENILQRRNFGGRQPMG